MPSSADLGHRLETSVRNLYASILFPAPPPDP